MQPGQLNLEMVAECLSDYANLIDDGIVDGAGRYLPENIHEQADLVGNTAVDGLPTENSFGKQRGRFDVASAEAAQRTLEETLVSTWRAIPPGRQDAAISRFNEAMKPDRGLAGFAIVKL